MKKRILALALTAVMVLSLAACGGDEKPAAGSPTPATTPSVAPATPSTAPATEGEATGVVELIAVEANGLILGLPEDIQYAQTTESSGAMLFANEEKTVVITVGPKFEDAITVESLTDEVLLQSMVSLDNTVLNSSGTVEQNGGTAVVGFGEGTLPDGTAMTSIIQCFIPADGSGYNVISYLYGVDAGSSLDANIETILASVMSAE